MIIGRIEKATRALGAPPDWDGEAGKCNVLPIRDVGTGNGNWMVSAWEPTPDEIKALQAGETVKLWIHGVAHPVVAITVGDID